MRAGGNNAFFFHAGGPGVCDTVPRSRRQFACQIPHRQAGPDQKHANTQTGRTDTGHHKRSGGNATRRCNQSPDKSPGNHPCQTMGVADVVSDTRRLKHNNVP
ncbi:hypothetical protein [Mixta calida]|uniref:hypothetical protein n=1 Tax=Mixta calida TaxID=665913 RepID=UPI0028B0B294|nr:hypothetical protein [Mixta calida]